MLWCSGNQRWKGGNQITSLLDTYPAQAAAACVLCVVAYVPSVSKSNKVQFSINVYKVCTVLFKLICINFIKCIDKWM